MSTTRILNTSRTLLLFAWFKTILSPGWSSPVFLPSETRAKEPGQGFLFVPCYRPMTASFECRLCHAQVEPDRTNKNRVWRQLLTQGLRVDVSRDNAAMRHPHAERQNNRNFADIIWNFSINWTVKLTVGLWCSCLYQQRRSSVITQLQSVCNGKED